MKDLFIVGQVLRPHGLRGEVVVRPLTDNIVTLTGAASVYLGQESLTPVAVEGIRLHKGNTLLKLQGIDDMDQAHNLKGVKICMPMEDLLPLDEGEYFLHDLVGLTVLDHLGKEVGHVEYILETGGPPVLTGQTIDGKEFMIPFASGTIDEVDLEKGIITLVDLPGLINDEADS